MDCLNIIEIIFAAWSHVIQDWAMRSIVCLDIACARERPRVGYAQDNREDGERLAYSQYTAVEPVRGWSTVVRL